MEVLINFVGIAPQSELLSLSRDIIAPYRGHAANPDIMLLFPVRLDCVVQADMP